MTTSERARYRKGSARFAGLKDLDAAGMLARHPNGVFLGFFRGRALWYSGDGGVLLVAGARSGNLRDVLAYNICSGILADVTLMILDCRGELAKISFDQTLTTSRAITGTRSGCTVCRRTESTRRRICASPRQLYMPI